MGHKPAPVQISYIGFPTSTGAPYIDYYLADHVALPAEDRYVMYGMRHCTRVM